jgi:hypothetical protein
LHLNNLCITCMPPRPETTQPSICIDRVTLSKNTLILNNESFLMNNPPVLFPTRLRQKAVANDLIVKKINQQKMV